MDPSTPRARTGEVLHDIERAGIDALRAVQLERLMWSLGHAYGNSPFYRKHFDESGVHPDDLKSLEDLAKFPFTTKSDLRDNYAFGMFAVPRERVARIHASSGTTGKPTVVGYTANDIDTWADAVARSIYAAGGRSGDIVHVAYGYGLFTGGLGAHYGAERLGCTVIPMSGGQTEKQALLIRDLDPDLIMVTPSYMLNIADELDRQGIVDRQRLAAGGHSYGAFSTVNAMVHTPYFRAGIAGDGNYNRTLTPNGFQTERRDLWQARELYTEMSPFFYADRMQGALLMYHGEDDQNVGTAPENSTRLFHALQGMNKPVALYMYPYEDHGPATRETLLDLWSRWVAWLDLYVKDPRTNAASEPVRAMNE